MEISVVLNVHNNENLVRDTIDSIKCHVTDRILLIIDGSAWKKIGSVDFGVPKVRGFCHNMNKSPYRNVALGLKMLQETWADSDWFCYTEYDVLFASGRFKQNLQLAEERKVWMLGNDGRVESSSLPLIEAMLGTKIRSYYYLLGCCQFFHKDFMEKLVQMSFFERFLNLTNQFSEGYLPGFTGYDVSEVLYPSLCRHFGGNVGVFASWSENQWHGAYEYFPLRWQPELEDEFPHASILHPLKDVNHPTRIAQRTKRGKLKNVT